MKERSGRIAPGLDDKILTSWNALMARAYAYSYQAFAESRIPGNSFEMLPISWKPDAIGDDLQMTRNYKNGKSSIPAFLDDYAFTISAFIELYRSTFDEKWLKKAEALTDYTLEHFLDEQTGMFFYTHDQHSNLIVRKKEISDNVIPSSNSEMATNLFQLGTYLYREDLLQISRKMLQTVRRRHPAEPLLLFKLGYVWRQIWSILHMRWLFSEIILRPFARHSAKNIFPM